jgi:hypothetical protein
MLVNLFEKDEFQDLDEDSEEEMEINTQVFLIFYKVSLINRNQPNPTTITTKATNPIIPSINFGPSDPSD